MYSVSPPVVGRKGWAVNLKMETPSIDDGNKNVMNALEVLDEEKQNILIQVLKCAVCLEIPNKKQVLICERGHHFCSSCHAKQTQCGICRGILLLSRNFVVEELVAKLGPLLGVPKSDLLPPSKPIKIPRGLFECPHKCGVKVLAFSMIPHFRETHSENLIDNVQTNPFTGQFCGAFDVMFNADQEYLLSVQISDIGFVTVIVCFKNLDLFNFVKILGSSPEIKVICYDIMMTSVSEDKLLFQHSMSGCPVVSYDKDLKTVDSGALIKISEEELLRSITIGSKITVKFSISRKDYKSKNDFQPLQLLPNNPLKFISNRKKRRNKNRQIRKLRVKNKYSANEASLISLATVFSNMTFTL